MSEIIINKDNFYDEVVMSNIPVLVDFWATWCGPCKMIAPILSEIATEYAGKIKVAKVNVDENVELSNEFGIQSIPTLMLFKNGEVVNTIIGFREKEEIVKLFK
ncbi:MAG: thioredoxin [Clostridia bacterium]|nr:thioredoxin [Clostridia bacterium]